MDTIGQRIKQLRHQKRLTLAQVAAYLGVKEATVQRYESGTIQNIKSHTIAQLAQLFECSPEYIAGWQQQSSTHSYPIEPLPQSYAIPLLGTIACGSPILAQENTEQMISVPDSIHADFALRCRGDSMIGARI